MQPALVEYMSLDAGERRQSSTCGWGGEEKKSSAVGLVKYPKGLRDVIDNPSVAWHCCTARSPHTI